MLRSTRRNLTLLNWKPLPASARSVSRTAPIRRNTIPTKLYSEEITRNKYSLQSLVKRLRTKLSGRGNKSLMTEAVSSERKTAGQFIPIAKTPAAMPTPVPAASQKLKPPLEQLSVLEYREAVAGFKPKPELIRNVNVKRVEILVPIEDEKQSLQLPVYMYSPNGKSSSMKTRPTIFYVPGTAYTSNEVPITDAVCKNLCADTGARVIAVYPRLAPENRFPIPVNDAYAIYKYFIDSADDYGIDKEKIFVLGYSSGANIAAVMVNCATEEENPYPVKMQILVSPITDFTREASKKYKEHENRDKDVSEEFVIRNIMRYIPPDQKRKDERLSPLFWRDEALKRLPPTLLIWGEHDRTYSDAQEYAYKLEKLGIDVKQYIVPNETHGLWWTSTEAHAYATKHILSAIQGIEDKQHLICIMPDKEAPSAELTHSFKSKM